MYDSEDLKKIKTLWPKYLLFKEKINAININTIDFKNIINAEADFTTPPVLKKKENNKFVCKDGNCRLTIANKENYTHALCYVLEDENEIIFFKKLNDLVHKNDKNKIPINDFEFIFKDDDLYALIKKCKNLFTKF